MKCYLVDQESIDKLVYLKLTYFSNYYENFDDDFAYLLKQNISEFLVQHLNKDCIAFIIEEDNKPVSCAILGINTKIPNRWVPNGRFGEIYGVFTLEKYRNRGFATLLINKIIEESKKYDLCFLTLDSSEGGKNIYTKCGFKEQNYDYTKMNYYYEK